MLLAWKNRQGRVIATTANPPTAAVITIQDEALSVQTIDILPRPRAYFRLIATRRVARASQAPAATGPLAETQGGQQVYAAATARSNLCSEGAIPTVATMRVQLTRY